MCSECGPDRMFVSCLQRMWAYLQRIWVTAAFYLEPMWAESRDVCGSEGLRLGAATRSYDLCAHRDLGHARRCPRAPRPGCPDTASLYTMRHLVQKPVYGRRA